MTLTTRLHLTILTGLLISCIALAQTAPASGPSGQAPAQSAHAAKSAEKAPAPPPEVAPSAPVITINGLCADKPAVSSGGSVPAGCKTVITRAEFENITAAINPQMNPAMKHQFAEVYPRILLLSHVGRKLGVENDPHFKE